MAEPASGPLRIAEVLGTLSLATYRATGQRIRDDELHVWSFDDEGKVTGFRHYIDTAKHLRAAGLVA